MSWPPKKPSSRNRVSFTVAPASRRQSAALAALGLPPRKTKNAPTTASTATTASFAVTARGIGDYSRELQPGESRIAAQSETGGGRDVDVRNRAPLPRWHAGAVRRIGGASASSGRAPRGPDLPRRRRDRRRLDRGRALGLAGELGALPRRDADARLRGPGRPRPTWTAAGDDLRDPPGGAGLEDAGEALEPALERLVADREREPDPAGAARAEALARRDRDALLGEKALERDPLRELDPDEERPLAGDRPDHLGHPVAPALVDVATLGDGLLRAGQRRDAGLLDRPEDPDTAVVVEQVDPLDDLRVPDHEPDPPAGHPVGLGHREHLDAYVFRARRRQETARLAPVVDEVAVGEVVHHGRAGLVRVLDGLLKRAVRHRDRAGVARVVQIDGGDVVGQRPRKLGSPSPRRV